MKTNNSVMREKMSSMLTLLIDKVSGLAWEQGKLQVENPHTYTLDVSEEANPRAKQLLDFYSHSLAEARREWAEEMRGKVNDMKYRGIAHSDFEARRHNALLEKVEDLLTGDNPERKV